jgi:serine/threonine-protein kinase
MTGHDDRAQPRRGAADTVGVRDKAVTGSTDPGTTAPGAVRASAYGVDFGGPVGDTPTSMEGTVIGSYRVLRKLGEGGMGAVYLAEHSLLGRKAAVKVLQPELSRNQDIVQRFFNEARAATAIADPGIVQIFDFGYHADGSAYIVMEFLEGEPLDGRVKRLGRLAPVDALRILRQVASSLASAHARGIVHRDLKPENIFLVADREVAYGERPKLLDFGIAKLTHDTDSKVKTATAAIMGTPMYMSPEQCRGAGYVDHRSDLYSLGCVLYHLLVGRPPFDGEGVGDIIACHLREPAPAPSASVPGIPPEVDALTTRLMAKAPDQRFASATELAEAIGIMIGASLPPAVPAMMSPSGGHPSAAAGAHPTTLSGSAGHLHVSAAPSVAGSRAPRGRRAGLLAGMIAGAAIATAGVVVLVAAGGGEGKTAAAGRGTVSVDAGGPGVAAELGSGSPSASGPVSGSPSGSASASGPVSGSASASGPVSGSPSGSASGSGSIAETGSGSGSATGAGSGSVPDSPSGSALAAGATGAAAAATVVGPGPGSAPPAGARTGTRRGSRDRPPASTATSPRPATTSSTTVAPPPPPPPPVKPPRVPCDHDGDGIPDDRC